MEYLTWRELLERSPAGGLILEFGVYLGRSFNELCDAAAPRLVYGFDSFRGLPDDWILPSHRKGTFATGGRPCFRPRGNGRLVVGMVEDTLPAFLVEQRRPPVAFCHFDLDLYRPTLNALHGLASHFVPGSVCLFDEWTTTADEREAFGHFLVEHKLVAAYAGQRSDRAFAWKIIGKDSKNFGFRC
jgi:hypothetical protein